MNSTRPAPRIVSAAMLMKDGHIVTGVRHYSPDMRETLKRLHPRSWLARLFGARPTYHLQVAEQGFIDQYGMFHDREEAWEIAVKNGQILHPITTGAVNELFSEHLY